MDWLTRATLAFLAVFVVVVGGIWESHRHVGVGVMMVLAGIVGLMVVTGANASHNEPE